MSSRGQAGSPEGDHSPMDFKLTPDLAKATLPLVLALSFACAAFFVGTAWQNSGRDIQSLQGEVKALSAAVEAIRLGLAAKEDKFLTSKDLRIFCFELALKNKINCPAAGS